MTDDNDRTQEIRRDGDRYSQPGEGDSVGHGPSGGRSDDTAVFDRPGRAGSGAGQPAPGRPPQQASPQQASPQQASPQQAGAYPPAGGGYRPAQPAPAQSAPAPQYGGAPMLPADRGSGGFPAAIVGAVAATIVAVLSAFAGYQILKDHSSTDPTKPLGFITFHLNMLPWPSGGGSDLTTAFVVGVLIVLVVSVLLMMAAAMSTRAGTGGFALFLAAWMASVIAGGVARPVAGVIARQGSSQNAAWQGDLNTGVVWGVMFGWIAALVLVIVHAMRRKGGAGRVA